MDRKLEILSAGQIWGDDSSAPLSVFELHGRKCIITDLACVTGCDTSAWSYTRTSAGRWTALAMCAEGEKAEYYRKRHDGAVRPCFRDKELAETYSHGTAELEYGEYPQYAADAVTSAQLDRLCATTAFSPQARFTPSAATPSRARTRTTALLKKTSLFSRPSPTRSFPI